jgi:hypothetical protein
VVEVELRFGHRVEDHREPFDPGEHPIVVLDHDRYPSTGCILSEQFDRLGIHPADVVLRVQWNALVGVHIHEFDTGVGEAVESAPV